MVSCRSQFVSPISDGAVGFEADWRYIVLVDGYGGINILGRSDGVLNPQGVRFGSAEIYAIVEDMKDE